MSVDRRAAIRMLAGVSTALAITPVEAMALREIARNGAQAGGPRFFTAPEYRAVRLLADMILPADARSGSATDAGVPEFIDFMMIDRPEGRLPMRGGLAWLDLEATERCGRIWVDCAVAEREQLLDDLAWPGRAPEAMSHGAAFFNAFRDLTATGFWTSKVGIEDLEYRGNRYRNSWRGCPPEQLRKLGLAGEDGS